MTLRKYFSLFLLVVFISPVSACAEALEPIDSSDYSIEAKEYFFEIALGAEFGGRAEVKKWETDVLIEVHGDPTEKDIVALDSVIKELDELVDPIEVKRVYTGGNLNVYFAPISEFKKITPSYVAGNDGFFHVKNDYSGEIYKGTVLISSDKHSQTIRSHLMREEITQALGLMRDSDRYPQSIFFGGWTDVTDYSSIDRELISMLYRSEIHPGMDSEDIEFVLGTPPINTIRATSSPME